MTRSRLIGYTIEVPESAEASLRADQLSHVSNVLTIIAFSAGLIYELIDLRRSRSKYR